MKLVVKVDYRLFFYILTVLSYLSTVGLQSFSFAKVGRWVLTASKPDTVYHFPPSAKSAKLLWPTFLSLP